MRALLLSITALLIFASAPAEARHYRHAARVAAAAPACSNSDIMRPCASIFAAPQQQDFRGKITDRRGRLVRYAPAPSFAAPVTRVASAVVDATTQILPHPAGCAARLFCGCGAAVRVFGHPVPSLALAANWLKFPRAAPAPGMAAARPGHVFVLEAHLSGDVWQVYDANSGGHATRLHARSLRGYTIVNPRA